MLHVSKSSLEKGTWLNHSTTVQKKLCLVVMNVGF